MSNGAPAAVIIASRIRKYIRILKEKGATSPEKAIELHEIVNRKNLIFRRLVRKEVIIEKFPDKYWLNLENLEQYTKTRRKVVGFTLLFLLLIILIMAILGKGG